MRVFPVNIIRTVDNNHKLSNKINFTSEYIPTNSYEILAGAGVFAAIISGIYYLGSKIIDKCEQYEEQARKQLKNSEQ